MTDTDPDTAIDLGARPAPVHRAPGTAPARVLIAAGSDPGGGAGIQADIKAVTALGGFAMTAITAVTVQDTKQVFGFHPVPLDTIRQQMSAVLADIGADAIKTGMLHSAGVISTVAEMVAEYAPTATLVVDPVMVATSGDRLTDDTALAALKAELLPRATLLTPNLAEAGVLLGRDLSEAGPETMPRVAAELRALGPDAVLVKGGRGEGGSIVDCLAVEGGTETFAAPLIDTRHTHGTGCTLASAIAEGLGRGLDMRAAVIRARAYLRGAIARAPGFGGGHGPLDHGWMIAEG
ncbi:hydroxymethylpyrimidine/phosphomethylpyrimidine kinase [Rhodothalassium salexigens DSM 2132]|uniref:hydroxymethylpyrimidine kinase n=1 Tax=Rhodothalassium salexigens DSM 2132 TaxID=1188247 RepID=A0A4R2PUC8_RHOSA|nr:bifunctional hydroxymethylpyrimidine kinase/phosphomethylpyrimidine kinase [Rhodothalassium salexigens]MBB4210673.1 hydroxymethylpyrimidine/phosphomethylpyrimidine kinase [Rhodothalassium salexigens DSM 2132]MBK1637874.1 bifunctional hydroxymethylpyrimidine kinase/phosphomethylpyrimidine kinase [Rhodothalassium salexigens DSM 2132]TCP37771.1 hydroxymethylpyrimidine/phosphomethylpyrimidine kinase [Rhodothalassium salexigens DSM 2132]